MFRARTTIPVNIYHIRQTCININVRKQWETLLSDFQAVDIKPDLSYMKTYYCYKSKWMGLADRDFILS